jgi:sec-independent protein translocase protein TatC
MMKNQKQKANQTIKLTHKAADSNQPFIAHLHELRRRIVFVVLTLVGFGIAGYFIQDQVIAILLRPAHGQQFIYTAPAGGFSFLMTICIYVGIAGSVPLIIYHLFRFLEPLIPNTCQRFIARCGLLSVLLAMSGALFGYFVGLPAALRFLLNQFQTTQIRPLLTIQEYIAFVMVYIIGFALLFQIPLILLFINRITPLRPITLLGYQRFVIAGSFLAAAVITPSGDAVNQLIMALPIIAMYQLGIAAVWFYNYRNNIETIAQRRMQDAAIQQTRLQQKFTHHSLGTIPVANTMQPRQHATKPEVRESPSAQWLDVQRPAVRLRSPYFEDIRRAAG